MADEPEEPGQEPEPTEPGSEPTDEPGKGEPDTFDREYVEKLRKENAATRKRAQEAEAKAKEYEDAKKTDAEKKDEELSAARERATYADKLDVALEKAPDGMTAGQIRKLAKRLTGSTKEELEADADELFADFAPTGDGGGNNGGGNGRRPTERLRPGAAPSSEPEENDPRKLAEKVGDIY